MSCRVGFALDSRHRLFLARLSLAATPHMAAHVSSSLHLRSSVTSFLRMFPPPDSMDQGQTTTSRNAGIATCVPYTDTRSGTSRRFRVTLRFDQLVSSQPGQRHHSVRQERVDERLKSETKFPDPVTDTPLDCTKQVAKPQDANKGHIISHMRSFNLSRLAGMPRG